MGGLRNLSEPSLWKLTKPADLILHAVCVDLFMPRIFLTLFRTPVCFEFLLSSAGNASPQLAGQFTNWTYEMLSILVQPTLEGLLNDLFCLPDDSIPLVHLDDVAPNFATLMASHIITGIALSPIELIRTRLVVQASAPQYKKYHGLLDGLQQFHSEEGLSTVFTPPILTSTILYHGLNCFFKSSPPIIISRMLGISSLDSPVLYALSELAFNTLELLFLLPVETIRRRMFVQPRPLLLLNTRPFRPIVPLRPLPYSSLFGGFSSIIAEEGGLRSGRGRGFKGRIARDPSQGRPWWDGFGFKGLYRGIKEHFWATVGLLVVSAAQVIDEEEL